MTDPTQRFADRADACVRWRPSYPPEALAFLRDRCRLGAGRVVADVGAGTGIMSALLLELGCEVLAVEPNDAMRAAAERDLGARAGFRAVAGRAEATTLPDASVDAVVVAQAFHWFDAPAALSEFARVLREDGSLALVWNFRREVGTPFLEAYERALREHAPGYPVVADSSFAPERIEALLGPPVETRAFPNRQDLDLDGLRGRVASASYAPRPGQPGHAALSAALDAAFAAHSDQGVVTLWYDTQVSVAPRGNGVRHQYPGHDRQVGGSSEEIGV